MANVSMAKEDSRLFGPVDILKQIQQPCHRHTPLVTSVRPRTLKTRTLITRIPLNRNMIARTVITRIMVTRPMTTRNVITRIPTPEL